MTAPDIAREAKQAIALIKAFSLELHQYSPESQVMYWLNTYRAAWIRDAIIEAVFQGRYKIISVQHILAIWHRRGQPTCHFTSGFEKVIASHLGSPIHMSPTMISQPVEPPRQSHDRYSFAPSPLSSSVITEQLSDLDESAVVFESKAHWSIDAFPVEPMENLVEVYKANHDDKKSVVADGGTSSSRDSKDMVHAHPSDSQPIKAFRPTDRYEPLAKI